MRKEYLDRKISFAEKYISALNPSTGSTYDSNANVENKTVATLSHELYKEENIALTRRLMYDAIESMYGVELANQFVEDYTSHLIYINDQSHPYKVYCAAITMWPLITGGLKSMGGQSNAPKTTRSFAGQYCLMASMVASQLAGAVATPEVLIWLNYFLNKEYSSRWRKWWKSKRGIKEAQNAMAQMIYSINEPADGRGGQSLFINWALYDKNFFDGLFSTLVYPDGSKPLWEDIDAIQKIFLEWFREERKEALLTFPVVTVSAIVDDTKWKDQDTMKLCAKEMSMGSDFFIYTSKTVDSLSSCCRLRNAIDVHAFSHSIGGGGIMTGSKAVITINVNRAERTGVCIRSLVERVQKYLTAKNSIYDGLYEAGLLPAYTAGYISLDKQYLTIGLNGVLEAAEYKSPEDHEGYFISLFKNVSAMNKEYTKQTGLLMNTELVPAESLGVNNSKWDERDGIGGGRKCYNSYLYAVEDSTIPLFRKMRLHGKEIINYLDGGSALHINNEKRLSAKQYEYILTALAHFGCNYVCENVPKACCDKCGYIHPDNVKNCPRCGAEIKEYATKIIGYLKKVSHFSYDRQIEASKRYYHSI